MKACIAYEGRHSLRNPLYFLKVYFFEDFLFLERLILEIYRKYNL